MATSINEALNVASLPTATAAELRRVLAAVLVDLTSLSTQFNQLRTDYNANVTIATDTTATAVTLTTSA